MSESASVCVLYQQQIAAAMAQLRFNSALTVQLRDGDCDSDGDDDCCCARSMCLHWMWQREIESVFTAALRLHWTSRKRESSCSLQFVSHRKKKYSAHCDALRSLILSLTLFIYYFVVYAWCCFFYLLYSFIIFLFAYFYLRLCCVAVATSSSSTSSRTHKNNWRIIT